MKVAELQPGDIISTDRFLYRHYGIYAGYGRVIHYSSQNGDFGNDACVRETSLKQFARGGECRVAGLDGSQRNARRFSREETVSRARSRMGKGLQSPVQQLRAFRAVVQDRGKQIGPG